MIEIRLISYMINTKYVHLSKNHLINFYNSKTSSDIENEI